jgi:hypothetical protein
VVARAAILSDTGASVPEYRLDPPVAITARLVWAEDGEERMETVALGRDPVNAQGKYR